MQTAIYCRVSTSEQAQHGYSLEAQERDCRAFVQRQGWNVAELYLDDSSGRTDRRPALQRLLADADRLKIDKVVFYDLDRFMRNLKLQLDLHAELTARGITLVSINDNIDTSTPEGRLQFQIKGAISEWFSNQLARKVKRGLAEKLAQGHHNGPVPLGYRRDGRSLVESPDAATVRLVFELYATGNHSDTTIAEEMNERGLTTEHKGMRHLFQRDTVGNILSNPVYIGMVRYKDGPPQPGAHEALIDRGLWDLCQQIRQRRAGDKSGFPNCGKLPLRGMGGVLSELAFCAVCGAKLHTQLSGNAASRQRYYRCGHRRRFGASACEAKMIPARLVEPLVFNVLRGLTIPPALRDAVIEVARKRIEQPVVANTVDADALRRRFDRIKEQYELGDIDRAEYLKKREQIQRQLARQDLAPSSAYLEVERAVVLLSDMGALLDAGQPAQQRALLQQVLTAVWLNQDGVIAIQPANMYKFFVEVTAKMVEMTSTGIEPATFSSGG
jgi:site-specific DNA recombinase